jgi:hypothetical protein
MQILEYSPEAFEAASQTLGETGPIYMVNVVRYRATATYEQSSGLPPCTGREAYLQRYAPAFNQIAQGEDYSVFWIGSVQGVLAAPPEESWDDIVIVRYANFPTLRRILENAAYKTDVEPHRLAALEDWRFLLTLDAMSPITSPQ